MTRTCETISDDDASTTTIEGSGVADEIPSGRGVKVGVGALEVSSTKEDEGTGWRIEDASTTEVELWD